MKHPPKLQAQTDLIRCCTCGTMKPKQRMVRYVRDPICVACEHRDRRRDRRSLRASNPARIADMKAVIQHASREHGWILHARKSGRCRRHNRPLDRQDNQGREWACEACWCEAARYQGALGGSR